MLGLGNKLTNNTYELTGGGTVYTPLSYQTWNGTSGLRWWYVNNGTDNPGSADWTSIAESGQDRTMTQSQSGNQPTVTYTAPGFVEFDGVDDFYRLDSASDGILCASNRPFTVMLVYKINTVGTDNIIVSGGEGLNTQFQFENNTTFKIVTETEQQSFVASTGTPFDTSGIKVLFISRTSAGAVTLFTHGGGTLESFPLDSGNSSNTTSNTQIQLRQISGIDNDGLNSFKGRIYETAVWQLAQLTSTEMENIYETYLYPRYSV